MKNFKTSVVIALAFVLAIPFTAFAQEEESSSASIDGGFDLYTSYIWRGAKFGSGPAFQPWVEGSVGNLAIGAWGSACSSTDEGYEMDLYLGYSFDFGLSLTVTDYYFGGDYINLSEYHYLEPMISYEIGSLSITGAYMLMPQTFGSPATETEDAVPSTEYGDDGDTYVELGYSFESLSIAVGAGNGQYVAEDDDFMVCNVTIGTSKEVKITDSYSLPLSAAVTLNPSTGGFFITAGVSF